MILSLEAGAELRTASPADVDTVYALARRNLDRLMPWMEWAHPALSREEVLESMERAARGYDAGKDFLFHIFEGGNIVGVIGLHEVDRQNGIARIGYWLDESATGKGLITNSVRKLVTFAFEQLSLRRIEVRCAPKNHKSRAIPERLGFSMEGTHREVLRMADGTYQDLVMYSLLSSDPRQ